MESTACEEYCGPVARETTDPVAERLRHLERVVEGADYGAATRFARLIEVKFTAWHNAKNGRGLSQKMLLTLLRHIPGLSADWILLGRYEGLSHQMFKVLSVFDEKTDDGGRPPRHR